MAPKNPISPLDFFLAQPDQDPTPILMDAIKAAEADPGKKSALYELLANSKIYVITQDGFPEKIGWIKVSFNEEDKIKKPIFFSDIGILKENYGYYRKNIPSWAELKISHFIGRDYFYLLHISGYKGAILNHLATRKSTEERIFNEEDIIALATGPWGEKTFTA